MQLKNVKNAHSKTILTQYSVQQKMKNLLFASGCDFMVEAWNYINYAGKMVICIVMKKRKKEYNGRAANEFSSMGRWTKAAIRHGLWNLDTLAIIKNTKCGGIMIWSRMDVFNSKHNGPYFNYVDQIMANIDHLPTPGWHWWRNSFCSYKEKSAYRWYFQYHITVS